MTINYSYYVVRVEEKLIEHYEKIPQFAILGPATEFRSKNFFSLSVETYRPRRIHTEFRDSTESLYNLLVLYSSVFIDIVFIKTRCCRYLSRRCKGRGGV